MTHGTTYTKAIPSIIETEHLLLRPPRIEDAFTLNELAATDAAFAHATVGQTSSTLENACTAIARMLEEQRAGNGKWWIVAEKETNRVIGLTGLNSRSSGHGPLSALASDVRGQGYAREAVEALLHCHVPLPQQQDSATGGEALGMEPGFMPPTRWYWQSKPSRPARPGTLRCA